MFRPLKVIIRQTYKIYKRKVLGGGLLPFYIKVEGYKILQVNVSHTIKNNCILFPIGEE
jgi:hypothetical protein